MPANLENLPFDVFHNIACYLEIRDYTHLSRVCTKFDVLLRNDSTARACLQVCKLLRKPRQFGLTRSNSEALQAQDEDNKMAFSQKAPHFGQLLSACSRSERPCAQHILIPLPL